MIINDDIRKHLLFWEIGFTFLDCRSHSFCTFSTRPIVHRSHCYRVCLKTIVAKLEMGHVKKFLKLPSQTDSFNVEKILENPTLLSSLRLPVVQVEKLGEPFQRPPKRTRQDLNGFLFNHINLFRHG